ncbi:GntR family transcriptional regulator [Acuticoccus sp. M5D2P5]|uniref:GntR family transcriptional regulator n=1 Tax=Acuticoccus kalidii TaxID=2910977 RepID=UPI001F2B59A5|nr:GntR family transcriptional regulator [Acuticoccus kalidii]MCF3932016.1 GntR family transcriptional regulator [Acuticoccus kalidii]
MADITADAPLEGASTLGEQIYAELEQDIITGRWPPEARQSLRKIATRLNTSVQPVREAVGKLLAASALELTPGRAVRVPRLDRAQADELWSLRFLLEGEAAARFAARKVPEEAKLLYAHNAALGERYRQSDVGEIMRQMMAWNLDLAVGAQSPMLFNMILGLRLRYAPFIAECLALAPPDEPSFLAFTVHIQDELVHAIVTGDADAARHLRCADLRSFQRHLYSRRGWSI